MSNDMLNRVWWRDDISGVTKNVAVALADAASDQGMCFPAVETIALKSGWKKRAVQKAMRELESMGLLRCLRRCDSSSIYQFVLENMPLIERKQDRRKERDLFNFDDAEAAEEGAATPCTSCTPPVHEVHPPHAPGAPITQREPKEEPSLFGSETLPAVQNGLSDDEIIDSVTEAWNAAAEKHPGMAKCRVPLAPARRSAILRRSKELGEDAPTREQLWELFFKRIEASRFLQGRAPPGPGRSSQFTMNLTWALESANFTKIMEGAYERGNDQFPTETPDGRTMGPAESATHGAIKSRRASRERSRRNGNPRGD